MKKILVVTGDAKTLVYHRGELLREFAAAGLEVIGGAAEELPHVSAYFASLGGRYRALPLARRSLNPLDDGRTFLGLCRWMREERPDGFFAYTIKAVVYGCVAARLAGVPRVYALVPGLGYAFTPDGSWKQRLVHLASRVLYALSLRCVDGVFLQNHDDETLLRDLGVIPRRIPTWVTLGSGVDLERFPCRDAQVGADRSPGALRFLLVTRLLRNKGVAEHAAAAAAVQQRWPQAEFRILGPLDPGPGGVSESEVRAWENQGSIRYLGESRDVASHMRDCDVFVLPTYYREGVPRSTLEALATGLPVITTDSVGSRETIRMGLADAPGKGGGVRRGANGWLIPTRDVESLAAACEKALGEPTAGLAEMGRQSRWFAEERFDVRRVNRTICEAMGLGKEDDEMDAAREAA